MRAARGVDALLGPPRDEHQLPRPGHGPLEPALGGGRRWRSQARGRGGGRRDDAHRDAHGPGRDDRHRPDPWTPPGDGRVEQRWESSQGAGGEWQVVFQGFYERAPTPERRCLASANGTRIEILLDAAGVGNDQLEMAEITFPGTLRPTAGHRHGSTEVLYILEGELDHGIDGTFTRLGPGDVGVVRQGEEVIHRPRGDRPVRALVVWNPGGEIERIAPAFRPCDAGG